MDDLGYLECLAPCMIPESQYKARKEAEKEMSEIWARSVEREAQRGFLAPDVIGYVPEAIYMASNPKWQDEPFGAANNMEHSGCLVFVAKQLLDYYGIRVSMLDLKDVVVEKGYRAWRFKNAKKTFFSPIATPKEAMEALSEGGHPTDLGSVEKIFDYLGEPVGIGGMHILLDNIIADYCHVPVVQVCETRFMHVVQMYKDLEERHFVPMRVTNSIYWNDPDKKDGHFVILVAIQNQEAIVIDSSIGYHRLPISQLLQATTVAWKVYQ